jgi:hypothetical protein
MPHAVAEFLAAELAQIGLEPEPLLTKLVASRIADRGDSEFESLAVRFRDVGALRSKCRYHLGIGASLTEFLIGGLSSKQEFQLQVASLGGIAHTIYALFDSLLDVSGCVPELFTSRPEWSADPKIRTQQEFVTDLVRFYFQKLDGLSFEGSPVRAFIERAIHKLYAAELQSAVPGEIERKAWWRKNALPIIVMALPAWFSAQEGSNMRFTEHLMWLGRVGEFLGWLDDFSDSEKDQAAGQANRLNALGRSFIQVLARKVAIKGQRVLQFWDSRNSDIALRNTFTVIVWTSLAPPAPESHRELPAAAAGVSGASQ